MRLVHEAMLVELTATTKAVYADVKKAKRAACSVRQSQIYHNEKIKETLQEQGLKTQEQLVDYLTKKGWICFKA